MGKKVISNGSNSYLTSSFGDNFKSFGFGGIKSQFVSQRTSVKMMAAAGTMEPVISGEKYS
jgi:hypothetical protein